MSNFGFSLPTCNFVRACLLGLCQCSKQGSGLCESDPFEFDLCHGGPGKILGGEGDPLLYGEVGMHFRHPVALGEKSSFKAYDGVGLEFSRSFSIKKHCGEFPVIG